MASKTGPIKVLHVGLGPIGSAIVRQVATRKGFKIVGAVDIDPIKTGRDLGDVAGLERKTKVKVFGDLRKAIKRTKPDVAVLCTTGDDRLHWLRAGVAMQRVLLTATAHGLATTVLTQPIEVPWTRVQLGAPRDPRMPQVVLRFGFGPRTAATPRRALADVLVGRS